MAIIKDKARGDALSIGFFQADLLDGESETGAAKFYQSGTYEWLIWGTFDGATAKLQQSPDTAGNNNWIDFNAVEATASGRMTGIPIAKSRIRVHIANAGAATNLYSSFERIDQ